MREFRWVPGRGMDAAALERLREHFPCPREPMGEAWFMGETREMYPELQGDLATLPAEDIQRPLAEIASGYSAFGPMDEWNEWYYYLLAQLAPRSHDGTTSGSFVEILVTGFIAMYPNGVYSAPYKTF